MAKTVAGSHGERYRRLVKAVMAFRTPCIPLIQRVWFWVERDSFYPIPWLN